MPRSAVVKVEDVLIVGVRVRVVRRLLICELPKVIELDLKSQFVLKKFILAEFISPDDVEKRRVRLLETRQEVHLLTRLLGHVQAKGDGQTLLLQGDDERGQVRRLRHLQVLAQHEVLLDQHIVKHKAILNEKDRNGRERQEHRLQEEDELALGRGRVEAAEPIGDARHGARHARHAKVRRGHVGAVLRHLHVGRAHVGLTRDRVIGAVQVVDPRRPKELCEAHRERGLNSNLEDASTFSRDSQGY